MTKNPGPETVSHGTKYFGKRIRTRLFKNFDQGPGNTQHIYIKHLNNINKIPPTTVKILKELYKNCKAIKVFQINCTVNLKY